MSVLETLPICTKEAWLWRHHFRARKKQNFTSKTYQLNDFGKNGRQNGQKQGKTGPFFGVPNGGHFKYEVNEHIFQVSETLKEFNILTSLSVPPPTSISYISHTLSTYSIVMEELCLMTYSKRLAGWLQGLCSSRKNQQGTIRACGDNFLTP